MSLRSVYLTLAACVCAGISVGAAAYTIVSPTAAIATGMASTAVLYVLASLRD